MTLLSIKPDHKISRRRFINIVKGTLGAVVIVSASVSCAGKPLSDSTATALDTPEFIYEKQNDMQPRLLVAYATAAGSTIGVAEVIGKTLATSGLSVKVESIKNNPNLAGYQGVIIGSAVHGGRWLPEAIEFVKDHQAELKQVPVAVFCVHILNLGPDEKSCQNRQAYLDPMRSLLPIVDEAYFAGKGIDPDSASGFEKFMAWIMKIPPGDRRDWDKIGAWASNMKGFDLIKNDKAGN
jgi:menaquinone-dependent protoporphyrinogen oxidase